MRAFASEILSKAAVLRCIAVIASAVALLGSAVACTSQPQTDPLAESDDQAASSSEDALSGSAPSADPEASQEVVFPDREDLARRNIPSDARLKAASLLMVGVTNFDDALNKLKQGVGGIFVTSWADPKLLTEPGRNITTLREMIKRPFAVSVDFEGGSVQRHSQILGDFPSARKMARMAPEEVRELGYRIGRSLIRRGIDVDFAPVLDVDSETTDVVGDRAFSTDPKVVADYAGQFALGLKDAGVTPVFKHFPGHGAANGDTHKGAAITPPLDQLEKRDLIPYSRLLSSTQADVMVGHIIVPGLGDQSLPGTLNAATYNLLRSGKYEGGRPYTGTIYTDDISGMKAVTDVTNPPDAAARAIAAGADQVLWSTDVPINAVIEAINAKLADGSLIQERFEEALLHSQLRFIPQFPEIPRVEPQDVGTLSAPEPAPATPAPPANLPPVEPEGAGLPEQEVAPAGQGAQPAAPAEQSAVDQPAGQASAGDQAGTDQSRGDVTAPEPDGAEPAGAGDRAPVAEDPGADSAPKPEAGSDAGQPPAPEAARPEVSARAGTPARAEPDVPER